jgi:hypothetical protein
MQFLIIYRGLSMLSKKYLSMSRNVTSVILLSAALLGSAFTTSSKAMDDLVDLTDQNRKSCCYKATSCCKPRKSGKVQQNIENEVTKCLTCTWTQYIANWWNGKGCVSNRRLKKIATE